MAEAWYVQDKGGVVSGPFLEKQLTHALLSGQITDDMRVRQSDSDWCDASRARSIFRQLSEKGWYVREHNETHGPFTDTRLRELYQTGEMKPTAEMRRGTTGPWKVASQAVVLSQQPERPIATKLTSVAAGAIECSPLTKWSTEPIRHLLLQVSRTRGTNVDGSQRSEIVGRCQPHERLLFQPSVDGPDEQNLLRVTRTNGEQLGCLSASGTRQILDNAERGINHVVLLDSVPSNAALPEAASVRVAVVLCPPGTSREESADYIEQALVGAEPTGA